MKLLLDQCVPIEVAGLLNRSGHDAVHLASYGMSRATDEEVLDRAGGEARVLISADTDFGALLARRRGLRTSVVIYRRTNRRPGEQAASLATALVALEPDLAAGAVAVVEDGGNRVTRLPLGRIAGAPAPGVRAIGFTGRRRSAQARTTAAREIR